MLIKDSTPRSSVNPGKTSVTDVVRQRQNLECHFRRNSQRAPASGEAARHVVAGDVLHDAPAGLEHLGAAVDATHAEQKSRAAPSAMRRAPDRFPANTAPMVCTPASEPTAGLRSMGSNGSICPREASSTSSCETGVPARAPMTSSARLIERRCRACRWSSPPAARRCGGRHRAFGPGADDLDGDLALGAAPPSSCFSVPTRWRASRSRPSVSSPYAASAGLASRSGTAPDRASLSRLCNGRGHRVERKYLAGVEQPVRIEDGFDPSCNARSSSVNCTCASDRASRCRRRALLSGSLRPRRTGFRISGAGWLPPWPSPGLLASVHDQGMEVAVAGVENVGDLQTVAACEIAVIVSQHVRQVARVEWCRPCTSSRRYVRARRRPICGLFQIWARLLGRGADARSCLGFSSSARLAMQARRSEISSSEPSDLDDRRALHPGNRLCEGLAHGDRRAIHELDGDGNNAGGDDASHAQCRPWRSIVEADHHRACGFGGAQDAYRRFRDDAELAFGADNESEEVIAFGIEVGAADFRRSRRSMRTILTPSTLLVVTPYFGQWAPPEFMREIAGDRAGDLASTDRARRKSRRRRPRWRWRDW